MSRIDNKLGVSVLMLSHVAGMVALPMQFFGFSAAMVDASYR